MARATGRPEGTELNLPLSTDSRADEVGPATPVPPTEVGDVFAALEKAVRSQRLYQANNPVYQGFIGAARNRIEQLWSGLPSFTAAVEEHAFRWYGRAFAAGEGRDSLPYLFYKDGIRFVTFLPGFEDELERFLDVVNRARTQDQHGGDDMVTLLWQQEFASFQYSYVDALAEGLEMPERSAVPTLSGIELTLVRQDAAAPPPPPDQQPAAMQAGQPSVAGLINRDDFEGTLYFLEPAELAYLSAEVEREMRRDLKTEVLNALFDRLEQGLPAWRGEILAILRQILPVYIGAGDLPSATHILMELNKQVDAGVLTGEDRENAVALFAELSEPAVLRQLMRALEDGSIEPSSAELGVFLRHLGPPAMPVLLTAIERSQLPGLQIRLQDAMEGLASTHRASLLALLVASETDAEVLRGAARLAGRLAMAEAASPLVALLERQDPVLRRVAVEALVRIRSGPALAALQDALEDEDREVRIAAARGLATLRYGPARARLEALLDTRLVRDADLTEKIAYFEAYGSVANEASVATLDRMLNGRRLLGRESPETRACAAMALGRVGSPAARSALQRAADEQNPVVRNAVMKALRMEAM
jgi:HEAT repeat protein